MSSIEHEISKLIDNNVELNVRSNGKFVFVTIQKGNESAGTTLESPVEISRLAYSLYRLRGVLNKSRAIDVD